jgi:uncharacterized protein YutE (UPF0331/DUF86 family)
VVDRERVLAKLDELHGYLRELRALRLETFEDFARPRTRRATERLLQIAIEAAIGVRHRLVTGMRLGLPSEEDDLFAKLEAARVLPPELLTTLRRMKGFRNILVHEYGRVDDRIVYEMATSRLLDFDVFQSAVRDALRHLGDAGA